jgi:hypothetical protein
VEDEPGSGPEDNGSEEAIEEEGCKVEEEEEEGIETG